MRSARNWLVQKCFVTRSPNFTSYGTLCITSKISFSSYFFDVAYFLLDHFSLIVCPFTFSLVVEKHIHIDDDDSDTQSQRIYTKISLLTSMARKWKPLNEGGIKLMWVMRKRNRAKQQLFPQLIWLSFQIEICFFDEKLGSIPEIRLQLTTYLWDVKQILISGRVWLGEAL